MTSIPAARIVPRRVPPVEALTADPPAAAPIYLRTASGGHLRIDAAEPDHVDFRDVALQLSRIARWGGATTYPYSVAQHSVLVADIVLHRSGNNHRAALYGLLHDGHEVASGDMPAPFIRLLTRHAGRALVADALRPVDEAIHRAAGLAWPVPDGIAHVVHEADIVARHAEAQQLLADPKRGVAAMEWPKDLRPWHKPLKPQAADKAEEVFLARLGELAGLAGVPCTFRPF